MCCLLHTPLATDKVPGPACCMTYLDTEINSVEQTIAIHMRSTQNSWNCCLNGSLREHVASSNCCPLFFVVVFFARSCDDMGHFFNFYVFMFTNIGITNIERRKRKRNLLTGQPQGSLSERIDAVCIC